MYFQSLNEVVAMAGHGSYVWTAYAISASMLTLLVVIPLVRYKQQMIQFSRRESQKTGE